jgi:PAS domain-containing protein
MAQRDVGLILMRQLATGLAIPVWLSDERGDLLFFNEPAEDLLGQRFDDVGSVSLDEARRVLSFRDMEGNELPPDQTPLLVALRERRPVHRLLRIRALDGRDHEIEVSAFPLLSAGGHLIGGVALFWLRKKANNNEAPS